MQIQKVAKYGWYDLIDMCLKDKVEKTTEWNKNIIKIKSVYPNVN